MSEANLHGYVKPNIGQVFSDPQGIKKYIGSATLFNGRHGFVLTAKHVVDQASKKSDGVVYVSFPDLGFEEPLPAKVVFTLDQAIETKVSTRRIARDIAILQISTPEEVAAGVDISPLAAVDNGLHYYYGYGGQTDRPLGASGTAGYQQDCTMSYRISTAQGDSGGGVFDGFGRLVGVIVHNGVRSSQGVFVPTHCFAMDFGNAVLLEEERVGQPIFKEVMRVLGKWNGRSVPLSLKPEPSRGAKWISNIDLMRFVHERHFKVFDKLELSQLDLPGRHKCYLSQAIHYRLGPLYTTAYLTAEAVTNTKKLDGHGLKLIKKNGVGKEPIRETDSSDDQKANLRPELTEDTILELIASRLPPEDIHQLGSTLLDTLSHGKTPDSSTLSMRTFDLAYRILDTAEKGFNEIASITSEQQETRYSNAIEVLKIVERVKELDPKKIELAEQERYLLLAEALVPKIEKSNNENKILLAKLKTDIARRRLEFAKADNPCTIKVGVLHSLSGMTATSETTLKDTVELLVDQQNASGGLLSCQLRPVVVDPASDWPLFAEKARELLTVHDVDVIFGNWTSVSRKSVLPVIEELNGLLFYPAQYEGEESSKNVFYTGAAPNQQAIPATDYYLEELGVERFALLGTDYVYPRTTNKILEQYLKDKGIAEEDIFVNYTPFGHSDWSKIVADVAALGADGKKVGVLSTISGDANIGFYNELAAAGVSADDIPVVAFSVGEEELSDLDTTNLVGHLAAWNYFQSAESDANSAFIKAWKAKMGEKRVTNDPMEAHYIGFNMWVNAVQQAGTTEVDAVRQAMYGQEFPNLSGGVAVMLPNHHLSKPVLIGEIQTDGQFKIIDKTSEVPGDPWNDYLPESSVLQSDWKDLGCGMYNTETGTCVQMKF